MEPEFYCGDPSLCDGSCGMHPERELTCDTYEDFADEY